MIVGLLRHAIAEDASESNPIPDETRALTPDGQAKMRVAAVGIEHLDLGFELVLSSPLLRSMETARIVAQQIDTPMHVVERLRPGLDAERLLEVLLDFPDTNRVLICGHQPDMSDVAYDLLRGGILEFKKGALAVIEIGAPRVGTGVLKALYPPAALRAIGGGDSVGEDDGAEGDSVETPA